ncbi:disulfide isomerase-like [Thalictrum thalictroides]|uniref:protein disulfide-isomerase n=1 Tax=Thalictrum thalictroides TaxID=46969 RepID=A0A7J6W086_THATH|nr:disulfide isomerase-like [Thalictrum thalictroides]
MVNTMSTTKPTFKLVSFALTLLILLSFFISVTCSESLINDGSDDVDLEGLEELLAIDEEEEEKQQGIHVKSSEADSLRKAQRIVLELSNERVKSVIDGNEFVLLLGYAPWCGRSAELMPQFVEAATTLNEIGSPVLMAKVDADRYPKAASLLGIKGYPTLLLFVNGTSQMYTGGLTANEIVIWVTKKTGAPIIRLDTLSDTEKFMAKHQMFVIGLFEEFEGSKYEEFTKAAVADNEIQFTETSKTEVAKVLFPDNENKKPFVGLVKSEPEKYVAFEGTFEKDKILEFLEYNKFPLVTVMTELNSVRVHTGPVKLQVIVFAKDEEFKNLLLPLQNVARKFKAKILFLYVDVAEENLAKPFLTLFGLEDSDKTAVTAFDNRKSSKYLLESDLSPSNLEAFCLGLLHDTLSPYFKSQPIPENKEATVQTVVGRTFEDLVLISPQNVLLEVHTPWCINCEATSKQVEKLAKHFKGLENLIIARIDASANEHPKLQVEDFPTLLFYPSGDKSNPIKLPTKSSLKDLAAFIKKNVRTDRGITSQDETSKDEL